MSTLLSHIVHFLGNLSPSLYDTIEVDGVPVNLTGATVKFQMREVGSGTLTTDANAALDGAPTLGGVRYDWIAGDVDTAGFYLGWWRVTLAGGKVQETPEFLLEIRDHGAPTVQYVSAAELEESLGMKQQFARADVELAVEAASRAIEEECGRVFYPGTIGETRSFTSPSDSYVLIDDAISISALELNGVVSDPTLYALEAPSLPNAPYGLIRSVAGAGLIFPRGGDGTIEVTGQFGWSETPAQIKSAARILAARILRRTREATFGVIGLGFDGGAVRIASSDPDLDFLLWPFKRSGLIE